MSYTLSSPPRVELHSDAIIAPIQTFDTTARWFDGGVFDQYGQYCSLSEQPKAGYKNTPLERAPEVEAHLDGTYLFAGMLQNRHFGHFLIESLCRLWPADKWQNIDGIVFTVRSPQAEIAGFVHAVLERLVPGIPVKFITQTTSVSELLIPSPICNLSNGTLLCNSVNKQQLVKLRVPDSTFPKKVYVSRSKLRHHHGLLVSERYLERKLEEEGYTVIHPQELSLETQLAYYTNAEKLIFADGSAFHLYVLVANTEQSVFVVWRRKKNALFDMQLRSFINNTVDGTCCVRGVYAPNADSRKSNQLKAVLDFEALSKQLFESNYIVSGDWSAPPEKELKEEIDRLTQLSKTPLYFYEEAVG